MEISNPKRILLLSRIETSTTLVLDALTKNTKKPSNPFPTPSAPKPDLSQNASLPSELLIHTIITAYYTAQIPIWTDTISLTSLSEWSQQWTSMEGAREVVTAIGAWIVCFERPRNDSDLATLKTLLTTVASVITHHSDTTGDDAYVDTGGEAVQLAICLPQRQLPALELTVEKWEDICRENGGWEWIDVEAGNASQGKKERNEFGELQGLPRMLEALESAEWEGSAVETGGEGDDESLSDLMGQIDDELVGEMTYGIKDIAPELNDKIAGDPGLQRLLLLGVTGEKKREMYDPIIGSSRDKNAESTAEDPEDGEDDVEELQRMFLKLQAARDLGADLPQAERKRLAAKAVREVMKM